MIEAAIVLIEVFEENDIVGKGPLARYACPAVPTVGDVLCLKGDDYTVTRREWLLMPENGYQVGAMLYVIVK